MVDNQIYLELIVHDMKKVVLHRNKQYKSDVDFELPENITFDQLKYIQSKIESDEELKKLSKMGCRLCRLSYSELQLYWNNETQCPK